MNEMYELSIVAHYYSVLGVVVMILLNMFFVYKMGNIILYKRQMSIFSPISILPLSSVIFTGVVMMAAKHLDFTLENVMMILFAFAMIILEVKRARVIKYVKGDSVKELQKNLYTILMIEILLVLSISIWMVV